MQRAGFAATTAAEPGLVGLLPKLICPVTSATLSSSDIAASNSSARSRGLWRVSIQRQLAAAARGGAAPAGATVTAAAARTHIIIAARRAALNLFIELLSSSVPPKAALIGLLRQVVRQRPPLARSASNPARTKLRPR